MNNEFLERFQSLTKETNGGNLFKNKEGFTDEELNIINTLEKSNKESKEKIINILKGLQTLPVPITDGHYRLGLHAMYILDLEKAVPHYFFGVFAGFKKNTDKEIIIKNVFTGNLYVTDHCFVKIKQGYVSEDIKYGDIILLNASIYFYNKKDKKTGKRVFNFSLYALDKLKKYTPRFKPITARIQRTDNETITIDKLIELTKLVSIDASLPIDFFHKFIMSVLSYKTKETKLMVEEFSYRDEFSNQCYDIISIAYVVILYTINKANRENINFIELQSILVGIIKNKFGCLAYSVQLQSDKEDVFDTDRDYLKDEYGLLDVNIENISEKELTEKTNDFNKYCNDYIIKAIDFIKTIFIEE